MKAIHTYPKPNTKFKYRLNEVFADIERKDRALLQIIKNRIEANTGKSRMTLYRWKNIKHGEKADIPTASLKAISLILTLEGFPYSLDQLANYVMEEEAPDDEVNSEK